jgi:hypothetical protein
LQSSRSLDRSRYRTINPRKTQTKTPIELARPNPSKYKQKQSKIFLLFLDLHKFLSGVLPSPPNRITEISEKLHLEPIHDETLLAEEDNETLLPPSIEEMTFNDDDKTLNDLLSSLHSTKVRRMHKYTDEQLNFMHKHNEFNRMLQSYVDVSIHNGKVC